MLILFRTHLQFGDTSQSKAANNVLKVPRKVIVYISAFVFETTLKRSAIAKPSGNLNRLDVLLNRLKNIKKKQPKE